MLGSNAKILEDPIMKQQVADSLVNFASGLNVLGRDKRASSEFMLDSRLDDAQMEAIYQSDWMGGKIVDIIPDEMTREWRTWNDAELSPEEIKKLQNTEKILGLKLKFNEAGKWARLYGGCLLVIDVDDGQKPEEPLNIDAIKKGGLKNIVVFDRRNASAIRINNTKPFEDNFRKPETYRLSNSAIEIHHSRVLRFDGQSLPFNVFNRNRYWGDSVFVRIRQALINANIASDSAAGLLFESNIDIIKITGLMSTLSSTVGANQLIERFGIAKFLKSNYHFTIIDKEHEEIEKLANSFAGIPDLLDRFLAIVAAASDVQATRLLNKTSVGMNATGEGDEKNFFDMIRSKQEFQFRPKLEYFDKIMAKSLNIDPDNMGFNFRPLFQIPDTEQATIELSQAQKDQIYVDMGVVRVSQVAAEAKNRGTYSVITDDDIKVIEEQEEEAEKLAEEGRELAAENLGTSEEQEELINGTSNNPTGTPNGKEEEGEESETDETSEE